MRKRRRRWAVGRPQRRVGDEIGLAGGETRTMRGAWNWAGARRPGRWSIFGSLSGGARGSGGSARGLTRKGIPVARLPSPRAAVQSSSRIGAARTPSTGTAILRPAPPTRTSPADRADNRGCRRSDRPPTGAAARSGRRRRACPRTASRPRDRAPPARARRKASTARSTSQTGWPGTFSQVR